MMKTKKIPVVVAELISAQNQHDTESFLQCFSENAIVYDEGKTHVGKDEIREWNESTNAKYNISLELLETNVEGEEITLSVRVSGTFEGSPIELKYHMELKDEKIKLLRISN